MNHSDGCMKTAGAFEQRLAAGKQLKAVSCLPPDTDQSTDYS